MFSDTAPKIRAHLEINPVGVFTGQTSEAAYLVTEPGFGGGGAEGVWAPTRWVMTK